MTLREKIAELIAQTQQGGASKEFVEDYAREMFTQALDWPVNTKITLAQMSYIIAGLITEPDPNVRRIVVTDRIQLRSYLG